MPIRSPNFKFIPTEVKTIYAEIGQQVNMKFAFPQVTCRKDVTIVRQLHNWVKCRDFLGDALYAKAKKNTCSIYSFKFDGAKQKVSTKTTYLLIKFSNQAHLAAFLPTINHFEESANWRKTKLFYLGDDVTLAVSSGLWVSSPQLISLYTLLWRLAAVGRENEETVEAFLERASKLQTNDGRYLRTIADCKKKLNLTEHPFYLMMKHRKRVFKKVYDGTDPINWVHNNNGVLSFFQFAAKTRMSGGGSFGRDVAEAFHDIVVKKPKPE